MWAVAFLFLATWLAQAPRSAPALTEDLTPEVITLLRQGDQDVHQHDYAAARDAFSKAESKSHHKCESCLFRLADAYRKLGQDADALDALNRAVKSSPNDAFTALAHKRIGEIRLSLAGYEHPDSKDLAHAVDEFQQSLALTPGDADLHYELGLALLRQEHDADGVAQLNQFLAAPNPSPALAALARQYVAQPLRAREPLAPDFSIPADDGQTYTLAGLKGKVVLLDFWASWCPPCQMSTPEVAALDRKFRSNPDFVLLGISDDNNQADWKKFMAAHAMTWPDDYDADGSASQPFAVDGIPTFIVLDRAGIIRYRQSGWGDGMGSEIENAIKKALQAPDIASHE